MKIGLRVDVDTLNGTREGVPRLLDLFSRKRTNASFFFSVGPDNMGRHVWRLFRWSFLEKMLRTKASKLYGWNTLLHGTIWPGPDISKHLVPHIRRASDENHEIGLHAWDHFHWQQRAASLSHNELTLVLKRGSDRIFGMIDKNPVAFAAPGWRATDMLFPVEQALGFLYGSDCRGRDMFRPMVNGRAMEIPQIPSTLPTYDEIIGRNGIDHTNYNEYLLSLVRENQLNTLTIHAEVEGMMFLDLFEEFLERAFQSGMEFTTLGSLLPRDLMELPVGTVGRGSVSGREGWVAIQQ